MAIPATHKIFFAFLGAVLVTNLAFFSRQLYAPLFTGDTQSESRQIRYDTISSSDSKPTFLATDDILASSLEDRYRARRAHLRAMCNNIRSQRGERTRQETDDALAAVAENPSQFLVVDDTHKLVYCNVPKVSCTSWKRVFLTLAGFDIQGNRSISRMGISKSGRTLLNYVHKYDNVTHRRYVLDNYRKFLVVRDPFTRLLSAYQNKISPRSRREAKAGDTYTKVALKIASEIRGPVAANKMRRNMTLYDLTFAEFIHWLVRYHDNEQDDALDRHWERIYKLCHPCDINYELVGKYETIAEDAEYILNTTGVDIPFPTAGRLLTTHSSVASVVSNIYKTVSPTDLKTLYYHLFYFDFLLFDYSPRTYTQGIFPDDALRR